MSSYNNIEKIKYASPDCVVTLKEYIVFEDERAEEKYVVFKFSNNVSQQLLGMEFEVSQYDIDGNLIEKSIVIYNKFLSKPNAAFVPNAKLKVNFAFKTLSVRLVQAAFDRFLWKEGQYLDNSYKFEHYAEDLKRGPQPVVKEVKEKPVKVKPPKKRKGRLPFKIKNSMRKNVARFPGVFNFLVCLLVFAAIGLSIFFFNKYSTAFTLENYDLRIVDKNQNTVAITRYRGEETKLTIPEQIGEYTVIRIAENAFKDSEIESVTFNAGLYIEGYAFSGCESLKTVNSVYSVTVTENAFSNCTSLVTVDMPYSFLYTGSLNGCVNVKYISINGTDAANYKALFGNKAPATRPYIEGMPSNF